MNTSNSTTSEEVNSDTERRIIQALVAISIVISVASSVVSMSSLNGLFSMINSLQLLLLLPLIPEYFPKNIMNLLTGVSFSLFSFDFIKFKDIPFIVDLTKWVSYPQSDEYLNDIGLNSGSSVINYLSIMATVVFIGLVHILIAI